MENLRSYSGMFIIDPAKQESITDVTGSINAIISDNNGKVEKENMMGKKNLAYPIKKKKEAVYYEVVFTAEAGSLKKMMRQFQINTDILRTLIEKSK